MLSSTAGCGARPIPRAPVPKQKRQFRVEIEAKVIVEAFDEASARKKIEKAFASRRALGDDVAATGAIWTYAASPEPTE